MKKTIGILGGMGPGATAYFFNLIIKHTLASRDQEHIPVIICSNPRVPNRTKAVLGTGPSPVPLLREGSRRLVRAGADFIVVPCLTAHAFITEFAAGVKIPFLDIVEETLSDVRRTSPKLRRVGLLASTGTLKSGLFQSAFEKAQIEIISPGEREQIKVMRAIFGPRGIKAGFTTGRPKTLVLEAAHDLIRRGSEAVIAGCTEVPLVLRDEDIPVPLIEPLRIAAKACIMRAGYKIR